MNRFFASALLGVCLVACCLLQHGFTQPAASVPVTERSIKAVYLYKFAGYAEWPGTPDDAKGPLTIGVLGAAEMADELSQITAGRQINDRPVVVRRLLPGDSLAGIHVLFIGDQESPRLEELLLPASGLPILVVTETAGALADGSVINFTVDRERVRFEVSLPAAERSRIKLSSRLLAVAQRVQRAPES